MRFGKLVVFLFSFFFFVACVEQKYIDEPKVGDVYLIEEFNVMNLNTTSYSFLKLIAIDVDTLVFISNTFHYKEKVYCLSPGDYFFSQKKKRLTKSSIVKMYADGKILEVNRHYEKACLGE